MITLQEVQQAYREAYVANESSNLLEVINKIKTAASAGLPYVSVNSNTISASIAKRLREEGFKVVWPPSAQTATISWD